MDYTEGKAVLLDEGRNCNHVERRGDTCKGIRLVKEGAKDVTQGLRNIEAAKIAACEALREAEELTKKLRFAIRELETAERLDREGLKDINCGVREIEQDLRKPCHHEPHCRG